MLFLLTPRGFIRQPPEHILHLFGTLNLLALGIVMLAMVVVSTQQGAR